MTTTSPADLEFRAAVYICRSHKVPENRRFSCYTSKGECPLSRRYAIPRWAPLRERVEERIDCSGGPDACWPWLGALNAHGYGEVKIGGRGGQRHNAHRVVYILLVGKFDPKLHLDHLCRNRACVNPAHMEPVTRAENVMRGNGISARNKAKTHCKRGHPLTGDNVRYVNNQHVQDGRQCRKCDHLRYMQKKYGQG